MARSCTGTRCHADLDLWLGLLLVQTWANLYANVISVGEVKVAAPLYCNPEEKADTYHGAGQCT